MPRLYASFVYVSPHVVGLCSPRPASAANNNKHHRAPVANALSQSTLIASTVAPSHQSSHVPVYHY